MRKAKYMKFTGALLLLAGLSFCVAAAVVPVLAPILAPIGVTCVTGGVSVIKVFGKKVRKDRHRECSKQDDQEDSNNAIEDLPEETKIRPERMIQITEHKEMVFDYGTKDNNIPDEPTVQDFVSDKRWTVKI